MFIRILNHRAWLAILFALWGTLAVAGVGQEVVGVQPSWTDWDQGMALLDRGLPEAARQHFEKPLASAPDLRAVDGWLQALHRLVPADSLTVIHEPWSRAPGPAAFLRAESLARNNQFMAAADTFLALGRLCANQGRLAEAHACGLRAARARIDQGDSRGLAAALQGLSSLQAGPDLPERIQLERTILRANALFKQDALDMARPLHERVLDEAARGGYATLHCDALNALGALASKQRRLADSVALLEQAREEAEALKDPARQCRTLANLGYQQTSLRRFPESRGNLEQADHLARRWGIDRLRGPIQSGLGALNEMQGRRNQAVAHYRQAIELSGQQANVQGELGARQRLAYNLSMMGRYTEARRHYQQCLDTLDNTGGRFILNWVLGGLAHSNQQLGYLDEAERQFRRARQVNQEMGDDMSAAWCLNSLGDIHALRGEYRQALQLQDQAREQYRQLQDEEGEGQALASMAEVYLRLGDYARALDHADQAAHLAESAGAQELLRGVTAIQAAVHAATGKPDQAEASLRRVLAITRRWQDRVAEIWALHDLAEHHWHEGDTGRADSLLARAWTLLGDEEHFRARSAVALMRSRVESDPGQALVWARLAEQRAREGGLPHRLWPAQTEVGRRLRQLGRLGQVDRADKTDKTDQAEAKLLQAVDTLEHLRRRAGSDELRRSMLNPATAPYRELMALYTVDRAQPGQAFAVSERYRAGMLADALRAAMEPRASAGRESPAQTERRGWLARRAFLQARLQEGDRPRAERDSLREEISVVEHHLLLLGDESPHLMAAKAQDLEPGQILEPGEHLLSYLLGPDQSLLFSVTRDQVRVHPLPARAVIEEKVRLFLRLWRPAGEGHGEDLPPEVMTRAARQLHGMLLGPVENELAPDATLLLALDGVLHDLPFAYLQGDQSLLLEEHASFVVPSLRALAYLRRRATGGAPLLAVGCVGSWTGTGDGKGQAGDRFHLFNDQAMPPLPGAEDEARLVVAAYGAGETLTGAAASEAGLRRAVTHDHQIIHFAAHGYADQRDPRRSYVVLNRGHSAEPAAPPAAGSAAVLDGLLQWHEIAELGLRADLVTLASCRSARGPRAAGEGVAGLAQAFLHGGGRCVLAALADVPDQAAGGVMQGFYEELAAGASAAEALRRAQLQALAEAPTGWPALGGFVLVGDGGVRCPVRPAPPRWVLLPLGALMLGLLVVGAGRVRRAGPRHHREAAERNSVRFSREGSQRE